MSTNTNNMSTNTNNMSTTGINTNIDDYTIEDLLTILNLNDTSTEFQVKDTTNDIIARMKTENRPEIASFFEDVKEKVLNSLFGDKEEEPLDDQDNEKTTLGNWYKNQYPRQDDPVQADKVTDRKHTIQTFDNGHFQMKREQLGINTAYPVPIAQGTINPTLRNVTTRLVCIDSQFRQNILPYSNNDVTAPSFNTDFTLDLSEPLSNVTLIKLYSIQIPTTWYSIDTTLGNTCFEFNESICQIPSGNYSQNELITQFAVFGLTLEFDPATNRAKLQTETPESSITFYKESGFDSSGCNSCVGGSYSNQNLGWTLGFRKTPDASGNITLDVPTTGYLWSDVPADLYGPKYCMLVVDDYNQNHLNKGLVNITDGDNKLSLPSYYNYDMNLSCAPTSNIVQASKSAPRKFTVAQLYSLNEILKNRNSKKTRSYGPTTTDVLAIIPLRGITSLRETQEPLVEYGTSLQSNSRTYFGPVNIERLRVKLVDDKGNLLNLHDNDWSFTLIIEQLYQY